MVDPVQKTILKWLNTDGKKTYQTTMPMLCYVSKQEKKQKCFGLEKNMIQATFIEFDAILFTTFCLWNK